MVSSALHCVSCEKEIQVQWKYCRFCGTKQPEIKEEEDTEISSETAAEILGEEEEEEFEEETFDKDLYVNVLSTRAVRNSLVRKKKELSNSVNSLLEQLQSGLITREYAVPRIKEIKEEVTVINENEKEFEDLPTDLPVEVLLDQIYAAEKRLKKIDELKNDEVVTKESLKEAKRRAQESLVLLRDQHSKIAGHLRVWKGDLESINKKDRKELEQLYIKNKTGEITEETYIQRKEEKSEQITTNENVISMLLTMID